MQASHGYRRHVVFFKTSMTKAWSPSNCLARLSSSSNRHLHRPGSGGAVQRAGLDVPDRRPGRPTSWGPGSATRRPPWAAARSTRWSWPTWPGGARETFPPNSPINRAVPQSDAIFGAYFPGPKAREYYLSGLITAVFRRQIKEWPIFTSPSAWQNFFRKPRLDQVPPQKNPPRKPPKPQSPPSGPRPPCPGKVHREAVRGRTGRPEERPRPPAAFPGI